MTTRSHESFHSPEILQWLLEGDVSVQYQTLRDLIGEERSEIQERIGAEGFGARFLDRRKPDGHWGNGFYNPKWACTHYTLLDLKNIGFPQEHSLIQESVKMVADTLKEKDGGINPAHTNGKSDVCINGMFLNYACYFGIGEQALSSVVDFILSQRMKDGGFNCQLNRSGASHSSLHTTLCVVEGIASYAKEGYPYRLGELREAEVSSRQFILMHRFYLSDRTGQVISDKFLNSPFPPRWFYDIVRALDYFRSIRHPFDERMAPALEIIKGKQRKDGRWNAGSKHTGAIHFDMEEPRKPSRWNTLRALRILGFYGAHS
ncbi:MAG: hypothetical protein GXY29_00280 [Thermotogaceae bacterium]|nr:hypothetical protein [Thermotogaceae bacterium]